MHCPGVSALPIDSGSRHVCAVLFSSPGIRLLCICAYTPYEHDVDSSEEFLCQLSVIDSLLEKFSDCQIVLSGDEISMLTSCVICLILSC